MDGRWGSSGDFGTQPCEGLGADLGLSAQDDDQRSTPGLEAQILGAENDTPHRVSVPARNRTTAQFGLEDVLSRPDCDLPDGMILLEETSLTLDLDSTRHGGKQLAAEHLEEDRDIRGIHVQGGGDRVEVRLGRGGVVHLGIEYTNALRATGGAASWRAQTAMAAAPLAVGGVG